MVVTSCHAYLASRQAQITYADFLAQGYPIGSGIVESGHKQVIERRLKGAGMHWTRDAVNGLLALRSAERSGRWGQTWPQLLTGLRRHARATRRRRPQPPRRTPFPLLPYRRALPPPIPLLALPAPASQPHPMLVVDGKPTAAHPWRRFRLPGSPHFTRDAKS